LKKILFHFQQVGGANALLPLIEHLKSEYDIIITGRKLVLKNLKKRRIRVYTYSEVGWTEKNDSEWLKKSSPDIVITDSINLIRTSDGIACRNFWLFSKKFNIPCIAYVDCWWGYQERFILPGEVEASILPDCIAMIDENAARDMLRNGFISKKVSVTGCPRFEYLYKKASSDKRNQFFFKQIKGLQQDKFVILFVSQPVEKAFGNEKKWGFTEKTTLSAILRIIMKFSQKIKNSLSFVILLHPEDEEAKLRKIVKEQSKNINVIFRKDNSPELLLASDLVIGMFSILLAEAVIMKRPVLSIQINRKREEILITNTIGATLSIDNYDSIFDTLYRSITSIKYRTFLLKKQQKFKIINDSINRWKILIEELIK